MVPRVVAPVIAAERIDVASRDIASVLSSANVIDAQVQLALTVERGSGSAVENVGQNFKSVRRLGDDAQQLLEAEVRIALRELVERNDIYIESVAVEVDSPNTWAEVTVNYINLRVRKPRKRSPSFRVQVGK